MSLQLNDETSFSSKNLTSSVQLLTYTAAKDYMIAVRIDVGSATTPLTSSSVTYAIAAKITKEDGTIVDAYSKLLAKEADQTSFTHMFDKSIYLADTETLAIWIESTGADDVAISGDVFFLGVRSSGGETISVYARSNIKDWIVTEFLPIQLATPDDTIYQVIQNAIRYWNTHSGHKTMQVYDYASGTARVQLSTSFKDVVKVYPTQTTSWIWNDHPLWTLLGITILDNVTSDLIMMSEAFRNYRIYLGSDFRWTYQKSEDPDNSGGYLYIINMPSGCSSVCVMGTRRIALTDVDITDEYILDWILNYSKALLRQIEGNTLRKSDIIGVKNDGQEMLNEGKEEQKTLQESLAKDGRWVALIRRV